MLKITHLAHAGFLIENDKERLIIDPADNGKGNIIKGETVNYLLISHDHFDHNNIENIKVIDNNGSFKITKINSYHDKEQGSLRGTNIIHVIETEDTKICHLGDLGHILTNEQINLIGNIDILLIPIGGFYTIDYIDASRVVEQLNPKVVIPMHYKTKYWGEDKGIASVDKFLDNIKEYQIIRLDTNNFVYEKPLKNTIFVTKTL